MVILLPSQSNICHSESVHNQSPCSPWELRHPCKVEVCSSQRRLCPSTHAPLRDTDCPGVSCLGGTVCSMLQPPARSMKICFTSSEGPQFCSLSNSCSPPCSDMREEGTPCRELASAGILKRRSGGACWGELEAGPLGNLAAAALLCSAARGSRCHGLLSPGQCVGIRPVRSSMMACLHPPPGIAPLCFSHVTRCLSALGEHVGSAATAQAGTFRGAEMLHLLMHRIVNSRGDRVGA